MSLLKNYILLLILIALFPMLPALLIAASPLILVSVILFRGKGFGAFQPILNFFWKLLTGIVDLIFKTLWGTVKFLVGPLAGGETARFMGWWQGLWLLSSHNKGFLVDGRKSRLSETATYQSFLVQGGVGTGKTSTYVMPNILNFPSTKPSFVITDTSGEIYAATSGYLQSQGYNIRVLNLMNASQSEGYNPMQGLGGAQDVAQLAQTLIKSKNPGNRLGGSDPFWDQAAEKLLRILTQCLMNLGQPQFQNLANLRHLVLSFDSHISPPNQLGSMDQFVIGATQNDPNTFAAYQSFVNGNLKVIQSVLMSADVALDAIATPEMANLTATSTYAFDELRQGPTAFYVMVNQTQMGYFSFVLNMFYTELFAYLLSDVSKCQQPVWLFLDEFGHLALPDFPVFATTARKYRVSFTLLVQSLAQLEHRYSIPEMKTIREAIGTEIYLSGSSLETARHLEARLGRRSKGPLMPAHEIVRMDQDQALLLHANEFPALLKTKRFFERSSLLARAKLSPAALPNNNIIGTPQLIQI